MLILDPGFIFQSMTTVLYVNAEKNKQVFGKKKDDDLILERKEKFRFFKISSDELKN